MSKFSHQRLTEEIEKLGYTLVDDSKYQNMDSPLLVQCKKGHKFEASLSTLRRQGFICPSCDIHVDFINPTSIPPKGKMRVIAFDQATEKFGLSIWDDGKLTFYHLYNFTGILANRLVKIRSLVNDIVINKWCPDVIIMEDIQQQHGAVLTYKVLAMLLGVLQETCAENGIEFEAVSPNVWRKYAGTCGKTRAEEKKLSVAVVKQKFNINVSDDVAEAILIGQYGSRVHQKLAFGSK